MKPTFPLPTHLPTHPPTRPPTYLQTVRLLSKVAWKVLVVDEAHRLKNPASRLFTELRTLPRDHCVLLTGTFPTHPPTNIQ